MNITMQHNTVKIITQVSRVFARLCDGRCPSIVLALFSDTYQPAARQPKLYYNTFGYNLHKQITAGGPTCHACNSCGTGPWQKELGRLTLFESLSLAKPKRASGLNECHGHFGNKKDTSVPWCIVLKIL